MFYQIIFDKNDSYLASFFILFSHSYLAILMIFTECPAKVQIK